MHKEFDRNSSRTQESIYIKQGSVKVSLFTEDEKFLQDYILFEGDLAIFGYGGHGYEILENDTKVIESKNGPFISVDSDKKKF